MTYHMQYHDNSSLRWLTHFRVPQAIPLVGSMTYAQLAATCEVDESYLRRVLRFAMTNRLFYEPTSDEVAHTSFSAVLVTDPATRAWVEYTLQESFPACTKTLEAYEKWGPTEEPTHNAYCLTNKTDLPIFDYMAQPGLEERAEGFTAGMSAVTNTLAYDIKYTVEGYNWASAKGTIVEIGGGNGHAAVALAHAHPNLPQIIVEDLPHVVAQGETSLQPELRNRVYFTAHDFFTPQPETVLEAKLFLLRCVLHHHSDKYARIILKHLLPALRNGATLVVIDMILPPPGSVHPTVEKSMRTMDMEMMQTFSSKERQIEEWEELFTSVDSALIVRNVNQPMGSALGIMEIVMDS